MRSHALQDFLDAAQTAFTAHVDQPRAAESLARIFAALKTPGTCSPNAALRLPVCSHLAAATDLQKFHAPALRHLAQTFLALEPDLRWYRRSGDCSNAGPGFAGNHANTMIVGPSGYERRSDLWLGASLMAPNIRYPDHDHPPEETYLLLGPGQFRHGDSDWFEPGMGGTFYNPPGIRHAMRSGAAPLFAFWALWAGPQ